MGAGSAKTNKHAVEGTASGPLVVDGSDVSILTESYLELLKAGRVDVCHYNGLDTLVSISGFSPESDQSFELSRGGA